jgi:hypothetical protein
MEKLAWINDRVALLHKKVDILDKIDWSRVKTNDDALIIFDLLCDVYHGLIVFPNLFNSFMGEKRVTTPEEDRFSDQILKSIGSIDGPKIIKNANSIRDELKARLSSS